MGQRCFLLANIIFVVLLCCSLTKTAESNKSDVAPASWDHGEFTTKNIGYDIVHAYRAAMGNGLRGATEITGLNATSECVYDLLILSKDTYVLMQYLDAIGKPRSGYLRGNNLWLGSYSECRDIPNAHFCTTSLTITVPKNPILKSISVYWGLCFPKSCSPSDIDAFLKNYVFPNVKKLTKEELALQNNKMLCPAESPTYTPGVKATFVLCGFLILLCFIGTMVDALDDSFKISTTPADTDHIITPDNHISMSKASIVVDEVDDTDSLIVDDVVLLNRSSIPIKVHYIIATFKASCVGQFFQCFSVIQNTAKILKTDVTPSAIKSINGIRVISITWVILGHTFGMAASPYITDNKVGFFKDSQLLSMMAVLSGTYSVDSFFFLSGLLVAYTCFRKLKNSDGKFNWVLFYVHRFWRLTPSYMFVILFSVHLKGFLTKSPFWYSQFTDPMCSKHWWSNLLYINNFYPKSSEDCIGWSWYLANDMQFFVITPVLILPLFKLGWRGLVLPIGLLLEAFAITAFIHAYWNIDPLSLIKIYKSATPDGQKAVNEHMNYVYFKPYCRIQVYLVGFFVGYLMHRYNNTKARTPSWIVTLFGWSLATVVAMLLVYGPHKSALPGAQEWNEAENVLFGTFHRFIWGVVLAWVTYACRYGAGGLVKKFLAAKFWIPFSRLTYNVYLIHCIILILMYYGSQATLHYDLYTTSYYFLAAVVLSYGAAYILAVVIEFPCANLEELVIRYIRKACKRSAKAT